MPRSRSRDSQPPSESSSRHLPGGADPITESDYFLKSSEFRVWLKDEKHKYFDELSGDKARKYFYKFVKEWNRGRLDKSLYAGVDPSRQSATSQTAYKWSFASKRTKADDDALRTARVEVGVATYGVASGPPKSSDGGSKPVQGPALPPQADRVLAREAAEESVAVEREYQRKRDRTEARERIEDMIGPRSVGRERMLEKKRERRENDRAFREREEGLDIDDGTLMGGGDSFTAHIARRDAARARFEQKRGATREDKLSASRERVAAIRDRDKATMDMFMQIAKEKYG
ncbi:hypothetical protein B0F90DRAFT_1807302 [Multifurca ochricompacta]|uniref:Uncharacterized protein n=1 Tax=Multifurca ochricompacta TaxID=376703 RepID=A0AAD4MDN0_9AGAM|nr:hypothetical protein B0F90DRAFT_1807302 [Multifurca ochricompacta]